MTAFPPIAIVGRACVLPGAHSPAEFTSAVLEARDLLGSAPAGRWRIDPDLIRGPVDAPDPDRAWSDRGGYVEGFGFDPAGSSTRCSSGCSTAAARRSPTPASARANCGDARA